MNNINNNNNNNNNSSSYKRKECENDDNNNITQTQDESNINQIDAIITTNKKLKKESPSLNEIVFWKVFRNIVLFKQIFSNFNNKLYSYYDLSLGYFFEHSNLIIKDKHSNFFTRHSNAIEIIRDNIKSNNNHQIIQNSNNIIIIIKNVNKNNKKTRSFYNLLFKTYSTSRSSSTVLSSIYSNTMIQFNQQVDIWIYHMVNSLNYVALFQFIKYFKINPNEIKKYLEIHYDSRFFEIITFRSLKIYNYLKLNGCIDESHFIETIKIDNLDEYLSFNNKFKKLIKSYKLIIQFIKQQKQQEEQDEMIYKKYGGDKFYKLVLELNEIQINQFTNYQLNSTVRKILKNNKNNQNGGDSGGLNEIIKKYIKSIYLFFINGKEKNQLNELPFDYYIYCKKNEIFNKISEFSLINKWSDLFELIKDKLELVLNILNNDLMDMVKNISTISKFKSFIKAIFSSNDKKLIEPVLDKLLNFNQPNEFTRLKSIFGALLIRNLYRIKNKEILELIYNKIKIGCGLFPECYEWLESICTLNLNIKTIELYEDLLSSVGKKYNFNYKRINNNHLKILNRVILKPSVYSYNFNTFVFNDDVRLESEWNHGKEELFMEFLSIAKLKRTINLDPFLNLISTRSVKVKNSFYNFLFQNISKETISNKINENKLTIHQNNYKCMIELTATIIDSSSSSLTSSTSSYIEYKNIIIGKTKSFNFQISLKNLLFCFYHLGRIDDIIYIFNTTPDVSFIPQTSTCDLYNICSVYYLELFINYLVNILLDNSNNSTNQGILDHLYHCLMFAVGNGFTQIFKNIISSPTNIYSKLLLNCKTESSSSSLFSSNKLKYLVTKSIDSNMFEISNLLIEFIDFSIQDKDESKKNLLLSSSKFLKK